MCSTASVASNTHNNYVCGCAVYIHQYISNPTYIHVCEIIHAVHTCMYNYKQYIRVHVCAVTHMYIHTFTGNRNCAVTKCPSAMILLFSLR